MAYSDTSAARLARIQVAMRTDINRISCTVKFWCGESLQDWGFAMWMDEQGYNGNLPTLRAMAPNGQEYRFDGPFHMWVKA